VDEATGCLPCEVVSFIAEMIFAEVADGKVIQIKLFEALFNIQKPEITGH
jgi:hypothetical protein